MKPKLIIPEGSITLKDWKTNLARQMRLSVHAVEHRLYRGLIPFPKVKRLSKRTILVLEEALNKPNRTL